MIRAFLAVLLPCALAACSQHEATPPAAQPALWAIEDREGATLGWLFGTIHALPDGAQWETAALGRAIGQAEVLVVEVRDLDPQRTASLFNRMATDEPSPPLADRLPQDVGADLAKLLASKGVSAGKFDNLESWAAALALARLAGTAEAANGVDKAIIARFAGRPVAELEGVAEQLETFDDLPEPEQRKLLAAVLAEQSDPGADAKALAAAWRAGDLAALERQTRRGLLADPALYEALAAVRNRAWFSKLAPMLEDGRRPLVAVGTAHMLGSDGLPALLAAKGYRIRRLH